MTSPAKILVILSSLLCLVGCAAQNLQTSTNINNTRINISANTAYVLDSNELALPCNKLKGRIQLRVLETRDRELKSSPSLIAKSMRWASNKYGSWSQDTRQADVGSNRDLAMLSAYNKRLGQLGCSQYDIMAELDPKKSKDWQIK